ncbi:MAG: hypothetical protein ACTSQQ_06995 [Candidatus Helarchaeota archaeon]
MQYEAIFGLITDPNELDIDGDNFNDWEEVYPDADGYITDPHDEDTDDDGLQDSAESVSLHKEYKKWLTGK